MLEMMMTVGIVLLIIIVIVLILSIFANITLGTPTPINLLVKPISNKIGEVVDEKTFAKRAKNFEPKKVKHVKTYELAKEKVKEHEVAKEYGKKQVKAKVQTHERTFEEPELTKGEGKTKKLEK